MGNEEFDKQIRIMKDRAKAAGFPCSTDEEFEKLLTAQGMSTESLRRMAVGGFMAMECMRQLIARRQHVDADHFKDIAPAVVERDYKAIVQKLRDHATIEIYSDSR